MDRVGPRGEEIRWTEARGAAHGAEDGGIRAEGGWRRAEDGFGAQGDAGLLADIRENLTNEANLCENASTSENHNCFHVTANSDDVLGLDRLETKPSGEWNGEAVPDEEEEVGDDVLGGDCDEEVGTSRAEDGFGGLGDGGLSGDSGENVTNEANLCENTSTSQHNKSVHVTATSDDVLGLDSLETKPAGEWGGEGVLDEEERGGGTEEARHREREQLAEARKLEGVLADGMAKIKAHFGPMSEVIRERLLASPEAMAILGPYLPKGAAVEGEELPRSGGGSVTTPERGNEDEEFADADEDEDECSMSLEELVAAGHITEAEKRHEEEEEAKLLALQAKVAAWGEKLRARDGPMAELMKNILSASPDAMEVLGQFLPRAP